MEIKPNMYIRFFDGTIGKVADYYYDENCVNGHTILLEGRDYWSCCEKGQFEASYNLIDLIQIGDYVNGMEVIAKDSDNRLYVPEDLGQPYDREFSNGCFEYTLLDKNFEIKSIVTKEQFNSMKYEVGE